VDITCTPAVILKPMRCATECLCVPQFLQHSATVSLYDTN